MRNDGSDRKNFQQTGWPTRMLDQYSIRKNRLNSTEMKNTEDRNSTHTKIEMKMDE